MPEDKPEIQLFNHLLDKSFFDIQEFWEGDITTPTWKNTISKSRIDYIWATRDIALECTRFQNRNSESLSESNHTILALTLPKKAILHENSHDPNQYRSQSSKIKTIILEETTEEQ